MRQNKFLFLFMEGLILGILVAVHMYVTSGLQNAAQFILSALTAIGTCGVMILSIFPYKYSDKLSAILYRRFPDDKIMLKIKNETGHSVRLGASNMPIPHEDNFILFWRPGDEKILENAVPIWMQGGLIIPPYDCVFFMLDELQFDGVPIKNLRMQIRTNTGYRCDVANNCQF